MATFLVAYIFLSYLILTGLSNCTQNYVLNPAHVVDPALLSHSPYFTAGTGKTRASRHFNYRHHLVRDLRLEHIRLSVFKGREAKLNRAIFLTLAIKGPQTISDLQKLLSKQKNLEGTYYASLTKRIRYLQKAGYITQIPTKTPAHRSRAAVYGLCTKAHLATLLNRTDPENLLNKITDKEATILLSDIIYVMLPDQQEQ